MITRGARRQPLQERNGRLPPSCRSARCQIIGLLPCMPSYTINGIQQSKSKRIFMVKWDGGLISSWPDLYFYT